LAGEERGLMGGKNQPRRHEAHEGMHEEKSEIYEAAYSNKFFFVNPFVIFVSSWFKFFPSAFPMQGKAPKKIG
jgi:hypothetical protein